MCGIFGVLLSKDMGYTAGLLKNTVDRLFVLSESRGKEAAGIAAFSGGKISVYKESVLASSLIRRKGYRQLLDEIFSDRLRGAMIRKQIAVIGHTRLITNGTQADNDNCPIRSGGVVGVHNGIIVNDGEIYKMFPSIKRKGLVDSELIFNLLNFFVNKGLSLIESMQTIFSKIQGSVSIATFVSDYNTMILATNTGSLYSCRNIRGDIHIFASESYILQRLLKDLRLRSAIGQYNISQLRPGRGCLIDIHEISEQNFSLTLEN